MSEPLVPVPRRVRPWQPHPALLLVSTARAFAAAHWDDVRQGQDEEGEYGDEVDASADPAARSFAQSTLTHDANDFRPWQARPFNKPLSELSRQALQRFDAELAAENAIVHSDDLDDALVMHSPGRDARVYRADPMLGHAAFKPDIYEFDDDLDDAPAQTQADDEEAAFANPLDDALLEEAGSEVAADAAEDAAEDGHEEALADAYDGDAAEEDAPENDATEGDASNDDATMAAAPEGDNEASEAAAEVESEVEPEAAADEAPDDATDVIDVSGDLADLQAAATADDPSAPTQEASATADLSAEPEPTTEPTPEPTTETAWAESDVAQDDVIAAPSLAETEAEAADAIADAVSAAST
ncbi:MAG: hypothetical protein RLZZ24_69, partial [Pseudomonadota bacterium]